jgi:hypothetical protein
MYPDDVTASICPIIMQPNLTQFRRRSFATNRVKRYRRGRFDAGGVVYFDIASPILARRRSPWTTQRRLAATTFYRIIMCSELHSKWSLPHKGYALQTLFFQCLATVKRVFQPRIGPGSVLWR